MTRLVALVVTLVLTLSIGASGATAATTPNDLVKVVFVHYRDAPAVAQAARAPTCPDPSTCTDNRWKGNKWAGTVTYTLDASGSGVSTAAASAAIADAFAAWEAPTTGLSVSEVQGSASCASAGGSVNDENQVCWRNLSSQGTIAVTYIWYYRGSKQIVEADTIFNTQFAWSYTDPGTCGTYSSCNTVASTGKMDIRNIATHEFGHFLALFSDLYNGRDAQMTMYGYGTEDELQKDSLAKGDCLGITAAYGGTCQ